MYSGKRLPVVLDKCTASSFNPLNAELNPFCHLLTLLGAHPILHISRIRVKVGDNGITFPGNGSNHLMDCTVS